MNFDHFDTQIQPEEFEEPISWEDIQDDNPIDSDFEPDFEKDMNDFDNSRDEFTPDEYYEEN
jgi:hypothetical protein